MNKVQLVGRLTKDPEPRNTPSGAIVCTFTLAIDRRFKDANGQRQADFLNCVAWNKTAQFIGKYFKKGNRIGACGSIQTRSYEDENGEKHFVTEIVVDEAEFVDSQTTARTEEPAEAQQEPQERASGELPFEI